MTEKYLVYGNEPSPYSVKVRSYFRYKRIPHRWIERSYKTNSEFKKHAKIAIVPLVITPEKKAIQDSTPIIQLMEKQFQERSIIPKEEHTAFIARLLEEYADEWLVKPMFHSRWSYKEDQWDAALRITDPFLPTWVKVIPMINRFVHKKIASAIRKRQIARLWVTSSNKNTEGQIEESFLDFLKHSENHLQARPYFFGLKPSIADFGIYGQLYQAWSDPTLKKIIELGYPKTLKWIHLMENPEMRGDFEPWKSLEETLMPILTKDIGGVFMPWLQANNQAVIDGHDSLSVMIKNKKFEHRIGSPNRYHKKSFLALCDEYKAIKDTAMVDVILQKSTLAHYFSD